MHDNITSEENEKEPVGVSRRTVVRGAAWSVPVIAAATSVPFAAASVPAECVSYDPHGVYGSSGQAIFQYVGTGNPSTFTVPKTDAGYDWAGNLAFGLDKVGQPNCQGASFAFYGSTWDNAANRNHLYKAIPDPATNGTTSIVTDLGTFDCLSSGGYSPAWGGMAVDTAGDVWAVSNTANMATVQVARIDPITLACQSNTPGAVGVGPHAAKIQSGYVGPDLTFTPDGQMWGLIWDATSNEFWMSRYHLTAGAKLGVEPVFRVTGAVPALYEMRYLDGLAWKGTAATYDSGLFYIAWGGPVRGDVYVIDPRTGDSSLAASKTLPDDTGSTYRLEDLASAPVISPTSSL
ncbi:MULTISPECIES: hypothetical protein [Bacteria]|uniref:hypothetical protein n=1 Tax=Bacteria TaxID=2 RepID=UPI003C7DDE63